MAQSKDISPGHPVKTTSIPSDSKSAIGCGAATKGVGRGMKLDGQEFRHGEAKAGEGQYFRHLKPR